MIFADRDDGGRRLAAELEKLAGQPGLMVVGLPRGGVPVAARVATELDAPLDVIVVRKLGVPHQPELAMGAIGENDIRVVNDDIVRAAGVTAAELDDVERRERSELVRRSERFVGRRAVPLAGRHVIVVDDGVATGATARAACQVARAAGATRVTLAVPVAPSDWTRRLAGVADEFVAVDTTDHFGSVGRFYRDFRQVSDSEVVDLLAEARRRHIDGTVADVPDGDVPDGDIAPGLRVDDDVEIRIDGTLLAGHLAVPARATGLVVFAHGSGSSRHSPRNRFVADVMRRAGLATLLFDLLTVDEERTRAMVFDVDLLADRLVEVIAWARQHPATQNLPVGLFGASTGAAAALRAAARPGVDVDAVVSRGGRPDLAGDRLGDVTAPTLLMVGGMDSAVLTVNRRAQRCLTCHNELTVIAGATHLFEEPGTLLAAARTARDWFTRFLTAAADARSTQSSSLRVTAGRSV